jgi:hypothetical protein
MTKESASKEYIKSILDISKNPIVLCSFGKDSMVMLDLIRQIRNDLPVIFFKEPFFPKKYSFANKVIEDYDLNVYDFPPIKTDSIFKDGICEITNIYNGYKNATLYLPTGTHEYKDGEKFLCAVDDLLNKPKVKGYDFPWDTIFVGHKSSDVCPVLGAVPIKDKTVKICEMLLALPIADWTDKEIWNYTIQNNIPYNDRRYNKDNGFKEFDDKTFNNDYHPCCFKCLDNKEPLILKCPKTGHNTRNISIPETQHAENIEKLLLQASYIRR